MRPSGLLDDVDEAHHGLDDGPRLVEECFAESRVEHRRTVADHALSQRLQVGGC